MKWLWAPPIPPTSVIGVQSGRTSAPAGGRPTRAPGTNPDVGRQQPTESASRRLPSDADLNCYAAFLSRAAASPKASANACKASARPMTLSTGSVSFLRRQRVRQLGDMRPDVEPALDRAEKYRAAGFQQPRLHFRLFHQLLYLGLQIDWLPQLILRGDLLTSPDPLLHQAS
jgi:hypothetical protein